MSKSHENLKEVNLKDKHLQKALQHAPDSNVAPDEAARKAVLDYADKALKLSHEMRNESWFARIKKAFYAWQLPRWQLAGMSSLAASLLVVVMIWHENPDNPVQVVTAPEAASSGEAMVDSRSQSRPESSAETKLAQNEAAKGDVTLTEQSPQAAIEAAPTAQAKAKSAKVESTPQAKALEPPVDKTVLASAPEAAAGKESDKETDSRAKEVVVTAEVTPPAPVAAAPAPIVESAPTIASAKGSADVASGQTTASAAPMSKGAKKMESVDQAQSEAKADSPSAIAAKPSVQISTLALALGKQGGQALANTDIQAGKLRILHLSNVAGSNVAGSNETGSNETANNKTANNKTKGLAVDEATGYRKETVYASDVASAKLLAIEVDAYNQTMREWHQSQ